MNSLCYKTHKKLALRHSKETYLNLKKICDLRKNYLTGDLKKY